MNRTFSRRRFMYSASTALALFWAGLSRAAMSKKDLPAVDLGFLTTKLTFKRRSSWTKQVPKPWILKPSSGFDRITVHHSGGAENGSVQDEDVVKDLEGICVEHKTRGYGDIAYHFVIDRRGIVWETRSLAYEGAHVSGQNETNIGVMLLGNYQTQTVTDQQAKSLRILIEALRDKYQIKRHRIYGHRDLGKSVCPGDNLYKYVEQLRKPDEAKAQKGR